MVISGITGTEVLPTTVADYLYNHTNEFNKGGFGTSIFAHYPVTHELVLKGYDNGKTYVRDPYNAANNGWYPVDYLFGVKSVDPTDNTEGSPFIAIEG